MTKAQFIENIAFYARKYAPQFGIKVVSPIIAQACVEGAYGTSYKAQRNNFFGLKYRPNRVTCSNGTFIDKSQERNPDGSYRDIIDNWYSFENMEMGVLGYFQFINISIYSSVKGITDPRQYIVNLRAAGYATADSTEYVKSIMYTIQTNDLTRFDDFETNFVSVPKYTVAIDAGHGSNTAGKRTPDGFKEHWINVSCAAFCESALKRCGINTVRVAWDDTNAKDDEDVALSTRQKIIKANGCQVSVSFHANAYGTSWNDSQGVETLISNKYPADSRKLAEMVQKCLIQGTPQKNRGVKTQSLAMCNCNAMGTKASILVEIGFMTNKVEASLMKTDAFCKEQAEDVARGICEYLGTKYVKPTDSVLQDIIQDTQTTPTGSYLVKINTDTLNVRAGAGTSYPVVTTVKRGQIYTIVEEKNGWGLLKSKAGWIKLSYTVKV